MEGEKETMWASQSNEKSADVFELRKLGTVLAPTKETASTKKGPADDDTLLEKAKLKTKDKVVSVWNNVKYGFNVPYKPSFNETSPIWFLGKCYDKRKLDETDYIIDKERFKVSDIDAFFQDFSSLIWLTYRKEFPQLENSTLTTDCGWGCMLRTGQMILANTLLVHFLRDKWRKVGKPGYEMMDHHYRMNLNPHICQALLNTQKRKLFLAQQILRFFNDEQSDYSPFSLHHLVKVGEECGHKAGDWYGPSSVAHILSSATSNALHPMLEGICVYVAQDCTVYKEDVIKKATECRNCTNKDCEDKMWRAVLILVPVRLGGEGLNQIYIPCIKALLTLDHCIGIIGGKPKHSLYFVGFQDNKLLHLDPHYVQPMVDMSDNDFPVDTFRCPFPRKMAISKMDPSCCIGFYCRKREDFDAFCKETTEVLKPPMQKTEYPIFIFANGSNPVTDFDTPDGERRHHIIRSKVGSFTVEGSTRRRSQKDDYDDKNGHEQEQEHWEKQKTGKDIRLERKEGHERKQEQKLEKERDQLLMLEYFQEKDQRGRAKRYFMKKHKKKGHGHLESRKRDSDEFCVVYE